MDVEAVELVDFSQVKTVEIGYRNSTQNKNAKEATMLTRLLDPRLAGDVEGLAIGAVEWYYLIGVVIGSARITEVGFTSLGKAWLRTAIGPRVTWM